MNDQQLKTNAVDYLAFIYGRAIPKHPKALFDLLLGDRWSVTNRTLLVELIASATALVITQSESKRFQTLVVDHCKKVRDADLARLVIEAIIDPDDLDRDTKTARDKKLSRWASAVRYLVRERVPPSRIPTLSQAQGEGVDTWARRNAQPRKAPAVRLVPSEVKIVIGKHKFKWSISDSGKLTKIRRELDRLQKSQVVG